MKKILIVDDEPHLCLLYETELRRAGFQTMVATDGKKGLEYMAAMDPDLVVLDIRLPGMNGIELMQHILDRRNEVPVIINTAYSSYRDNYLTWAADAYLIKSSDVSELVEKAHELA
jgi:DNA-binding response OmpR family regulator